MTQVKVWWLEEEHERKIMAEEVNLDQSLGEITNVSSVRKNDTTRKIVQIVKEKKKRKLLILVMQQLQKKI